MSLSVFPMRMTLPIASPAAMMGWITWDVDGAGCSSTTGTLPRSLALRHLASLSLITASSWLLINFPMNSLLPGPAAATTWSWSVMQESMPVEWERDSAYSFAKRLSSPIGEYFFWDDHPAQIIYSSYDSCGFHLSVPPVLYDAIVGNN